MLVWAATVVIFFSLPQSKLLGYVLPAMPALAVLMADGFMALGEPTVRARFLWNASAVLSATLSIAAVIVIAMDPGRSARQLAQALAAQRGAAEPVLMIGNYYFDLPFYAGLSAPVVVVDEWSALAHDTRDNWRKELADAGRFAPTRASGVLVERAALAATLCQHPVSWVIGSTESRARYAYLATAQVQLSRHGTSVWRIDRQLPAVASSLQCEGTPSGGPTDR